MLKRRRNPRLPVGPKKIAPSFQYVRQQSRLITGLEAMCRKLNLLNDADVDFYEGLPSLQNEKTHWRWAEEVVKSLACRAASHSEQVLRAIEVYEKHFGPYSFGKLIIRVSPKRPFKPVCSVEIPPTINDASHRQYLAYQLWDLIFAQKGYERLKRCLWCEKWFVDRGTNKQGKACSASCRDRHWNRPTRRACQEHGKHTSEKEVRS